MGKGGENYYLTFHYCLADGRLCWALRCHVAAWLCLKINDTWRRFDPVNLWWRHWPPLIVKPSELIPALMDAVSCRWKRLIWTAQICIFQYGVKLTSERAVSKSLIRSSVQYENVMLNLRCYLKGENSFFLIYNHAACLFPNFNFWAIWISRHSLRMLYVNHRRINQLYSF